MEGITVAPDTVITGDFGSYLIKEIIGEGVCAKVARCVDLSTNTDVVVKFSRLEDCHYTKHEAELLRKLSKKSHKNVVKFIDSFFYEQHWCLVLEHLDISLFDYVHQASEDISIFDIRDVTKELLSALQKLGKCGLVHADLKLDNVMLADQCRPLRAKLIDFGETTTAASLIPGVQIQATGFQAPEVILGGKIGKAADMWGLGCILTHMFMRENLFPQQFVYDELRAITQICGMPDLQQLKEGLFTEKFFINQDGLYRLKTPEEFYGNNTTMPSDNFLCLEDMKARRQSPQTTEEEEATRQFFDLLRQMLQVNPKKRISVKKALKHPFVRSNKWSIFKYPCSPEKRDKDILDASDKRHDRSPALSGDAKETTTSPEKKSNITHRARQWFRNVMKRGDKVSKPSGRRCPASCFNFSSAKEKSIPTSQKINEQVKPDLTTHSKSTKKSQKTRSLGTNNDHEKDPKECWTESSAQKSTTAKDVKKGPTVMNKIGRFFCGMWKTTVCEI